MISSGIRISQLVKKLERLKQKHGDVQVFCRGRDYPRRC